MCLKCLHSINKSAVSLSLTNYLQVKKQNKQTNKKKPTKTKIKTVEETGM